MRITEVNETAELRRRNIHADQEDYEEYNGDEEEYVTDDEYYDEDDEDAGQTLIKPGATKNFRARISSVAAALAPNRIGHTLKSTSVSLLQQGKAAARTAGNVAWIVTTSLILVGLPVLYAYDREKNTAAQTGQMLALDVDK